ncbi:ABC transporter permease [Microbacterium sp.]|uniref:ABC transporter permease n=1 Tax=Microbacterium sp. TaxID=51671 RepID=UPI0039E2D0DB
MNLPRLKLLLAQNGIFLALLALFAAFALTNPNFAGLPNVSNILGQSVELALVALPLALLVISGSIDFSVGSIASLATVSAAIAMRETGSFWLGVAVGLLVGAAAGVVNGILVAYWGLNSFVVTLGFLSVWGGLALLLTNGRGISGRDLPGEFAALASLKIGPFPITLAILAVAIVVAWWVLGHTAFGKQIFATGGSRRAAVLMGVPVRRVQFLLFVATGVGAALAGMLLAAKVQSASPTVGAGLELDALTVVLLGGVAITGGIGKIGAVIGGVLFLRVLRNGLAFLQAPPFLQTILIGATLVVAVALDSTVQKVVRSSWSRMRTRTPEATTAGAAA